MADTEIVAPVAVVPDVTPAPVADVTSPALDLETLRKELSDARKEAAKYRTTLRTQETAQEAAAAASLIEQGKFKELYEKEQAARTVLEAQVAQAAAATLTATLQLAAATAAGLSPSMASRLVGTTPEELAADAKTLAELFKIAPPSTGASNPATSRGQQQPAAFDPKHPPRLSSIDWKT